MSCTDFEPSIVDLARGAIGAGLHDTEAARHMRTCSRCAALFDRERGVSAAIRLLAEEGLEPPPADQRGEAALLAAFDAHWAQAGPAEAGRHAAAADVGSGFPLLLRFGATRRPPSFGANNPGKLRRDRADATAEAGSARRGGGSRTSGRWVWGTVATAAVVLVATLVGITFSNAPHDDAAAQEVAVELTGFVPWPGADAGPPFESGELVRIDLPVSALPALGMWPPSSDVTVVQADVIVGQDGFARAVRLVQ